MKKYITLILVAVFSIVAVSCNDRNDEVLVQDNDTYPMMRDITANFTPASNYTFSQGIDIQSTDVVLIYRQSGVNNGNPIWQQIPRTLFLAEGELDYDFDFTRNDILLKVGGNIDLAIQNSTFSANYLTNQRFRVVLVPASQGKNAQVNYSDYYSVIKYYNIPDRK